MGPLESGPTAGPSRPDPSEESASSSSLPRLADYSERGSFTAPEMEHILQLPMVDVVELLAGLPRTGPGAFDGAACRNLVGKLARGRLFADLIARQAVNAEPSIVRAADCQREDGFHLLNATTGEEFTVRFSGDLALYLQSWRAQRSASERATED